MKSTILIFVTVILGYSQLSAQSFNNPDLDGTPSGTVPPTGWQYVPYTDPLNISMSAVTATSDLCDLTTSSPSAGLFGQAYSGSTFLAAGLSYRSASPPPYQYTHDGLMQEVNGFSPGCEYTITLHQALLKQSGGPPWVDSCGLCDSSGSWAIYKDSTLIGVTAPSFNDTIGIFDPNLVWERRSVSFVATDTVHTIKFLVMDDDTSIVHYEQGGALRMALDSIGLTATGAPEFSLGADTVLCSGQSLTLNVPHQNASYTWQDGSTDSTYLVTQSGTYWVELTLPCGSRIDSINVQYTSSSAVQLPQDTILCAGETLMLTAGSSGGNYTWQDLSTSNQFLVTGPGTYWVSVTNLCGTDSDTIHVDYLTSPYLDLGNDTTFCIGDSVLLTATANTPLIWDNGSTDSTRSISQTGLYWVQSTNQCGTTTDSVFVNFAEYPVVEIGPDTTLCFGSLLSTNNPNTLWQDGSIQSSYAVTSSGLYYAIVSNQGCTASDSVVIVVSPCIAEVELILPNVITINGDGINDIYTPIKIKGIKTLHTKILNRWGNLIFETHDLQINWSPLADEVNDGTYFYIAAFEDINGESGVLHGHITVND